MEREPAQVGILLQPTGVRDLSASPQSIIDEGGIDPEIAHQRVVAEPPGVARRAHDRRRLRRHGS